MLEAQCSLQPDSKDGSRLLGDVIVLALPGHPWGTRDQIDLVVAEWDDADLETRLIARQLSGEEWPVISYPYSVYEQDPHFPNRKILVQRSSRTLDVSALSKNITTQVADKTTATPILATTDYVERDDSQVDNLLVKGIKAIGAVFTSLWSKVVG